MLTQGGVILDYPAGTLGRYGPANEDERREIRRWTLWDNYKFTANIAMLCWMLQFNPEGIFDPAVIAFLSARQRRVKDPGDAPRGSTLRRRGPADHRGLFADRLALLPHRVRGRLVGVPGGRRVGRAHRGRVWLETSVRPDARTPAAGQAGLAWARSRDTCC